MRGTCPRFRLCLVTDRRRLAGPTASFDRARACLLSQIRFAVDARIDLVQVRERDLAASALAALVEEIVAATRHTATRVVVNDRLDVALACGADGVHLRGDSMPPSEARRLAPRPFLIGRSVHGVDDVARAGGADYLMAGTVFPSTSKGPAAALLGIDGLAAIVRASRVPVFAIGGIAERHADELAATGAAGVAAIGLFIERFDSLKTAP